jgi:Icc-related predicted phosphoesterase
MIIDCVGCLHGHFPKLDGGDLLIVTGDLTAKGNFDEYQNFFYWLFQQYYKKKIFVAGKHDSEFQNFSFEFAHSITDCVYLCDSGTEFEGLKIWGTPHSLYFDRINPKCAAFTGDEEYLKEKYDKMLSQDRIDILISHSPFYGVLDQNEDGYLCGSHELRNIVDKVKPKLFICSHIHEQGGNQLLYKHQGPNTWCVNCSIMNEKYQPVNQPVRIEL